MAIRAAMCIQFALEGLQGSRGVLIWESMPPISEGLSVSWVTKGAQSERHTAEPTALCRPPLHLQHTLETAVCNVSVKKNLTYVGSLLFIVVVKATTFFYHKADNATHINASW